MSATSSPFSLRIGRFRKGVKQGDPESPKSPETPVTPHSSHGLLGNRVESEPQSPLVGYPYQHFSAQTPPIFYVPEQGYRATSRQINTDDSSQIGDQGIELQEMRFAAEATDSVSESDTLSGHAWNSKPISSDPGPGNPQTSSSLAASVARRRNGTPPGLYGRRAMEKRQSAMSHQTSGDDVESWQTEESGDVSDQHAGRSAFTGIGWAGSSLADNSDAGGVSPPKLTPAKLALETAFAGSQGGFKLFRRTRTRDSTIRPAYRSQNVLDGQNLHELDNITPSNTYRQLVPLSAIDPAYLSQKGLGGQICYEVEDNTPYKTYTVPVSAVNPAYRLQNGLEDQVRYEVEDNTPYKTYRHPAPLSAGHANPFVSSPPLLRINREMADEAMSGNPASQSPGVNKLKIEQGAEPQPSKSAITEPDTLRLNGSFAKVNVVDSRANFTGTLAGLGAREVGSSLADDSSPAAMLSSSPYQESDSPFADHHTESNKETEVDSPLESVSRKRHTHDGTLEIGRVAGPDNFYERAQSPQIDPYSSDLDEVNSEVSETVSTYPPSLASALNTDYHQTLSSNSRVTNRPTPPLPEEQRYSVPLELIRSPRSTNIARRPLGEDQATSSGSVMVENIEMQRLEPNTNMQMRMRSPQRIQRLLEEGGMVSAHFENAQGLSIDEVVQALGDQTATPHVTTMVNSVVNSGTDRTTPGVNIHHTDLPVPTLEFPRLVRRSKPSSNTNETQIKCSRIVFGLCTMFPPAFLFYGHGYLAGVCASLSGGIAQDFDGHYKVAALVLGYIFLVGTFLAIGLAFWAI